MMRRLFGGGAYSRKDGTQRFLENYTTIPYGLIQNQRRFELRESEFPYMYSTTVGSGQDFLDVCKAFVLLFHYQQFL